MRHSYWFLRGYNTASRGWPSMWSPSHLPIGSIEWHEWHKGHAAFRTGRGFNV